jgi:hypothetical protein
MRVSARVWRSAGIGKLEERGNSRFPEGITERKARAKTPAVTRS